MLSQKPFSPPVQLQSIQEWFASIITHPLGKNETIQPRTAHGTLISQEAAQYITPRPNLPSHLRMQIYNQQYWWRLFNTLHANFPLVTRLFGYQAFNQNIAVPYLSQYPPNHWSINVLGKRLPQWIAESYKAPDRSLVFDSASLDWAFMENLITTRHPPLDLCAMLKQNPDSLLSTPFYLQPSMTLFAWEYDLLTFRGEVLEQSAEERSRLCPPSPSKDKSYFIILYRNRHDNLAWREITQAEFTLLKRFETGSTMEEACAYIESQDPLIYQNAEENLQQWLQEWTQAGWLSLHH
ncbi:MAG: putative DNA-binding domain-containing protein [Parachlamydiaceae bacterium]